MGSTSEENHLTDIIKEIIKYKTVATKWRWTIGVTKS